ncbi:MAG TPA: hypothetical protein DCF91_12785 [Porphyromonadaceae bacterium]|nr:hypothetical protein [Porphyromonadaceae bacterium]
MSVINGYYRFEKTTDKKTRIDCTASTGNYSNFEDLKRNGKLTIYLTGAHAITSSRARKPDLALSKTVHISGLYRQSLENPVYFGDVKGSSDVFLCKIEGEIINGALAKGGVLHIYIAQGQTGNELQLYNAFMDGELETDVSLVEAKAALNGLK